MRAVHLSDLDIAARVLAPRPATSQAALARRMVLLAKAADAYRKRKGRAHPDWGAGALQDAARHLARPAAIDARDPSYRQGLAAILEALAGDQHG